MTQTCATAPKPASGNNNLVERAVVKLRPAQTTLPSDSRRASGNKVPLLRHECRHGNVWQMDIDTIRDGRKVKDHSLHVLKLEEGIPIGWLHRPDPEFGVDLQCISI